MGTFIIGYMIINEIAGVAMAAGYINHLKKNGYFMQRKIEKWRSKKPYSDVEFWTAFNLLEKALKEAKAKVKKNCSSLVGLLLMMLGKFFKMTSVVSLRMFPFMLSKIFIVPHIKR